MSRESWTLVKNNKSFNVHVYRRGVVALIISLGLSCVIMLLIFYSYLHEPETDFYATDGVTPLVQLKALLAPNMTSTALLEPDPPDDNSVRVIPQ